MKLFIALLITLLFQLPSTQVFASNADLGPSLGTKIPHSLTLPNTNGETQSFDALKGEKGLVIVFVRSADWCPYCKQQLLDIQSRLSNIQDARFNVVSISYDSVEKIAGFKNQYDIDYTMLSDSDSDSIKAFGILNETYKAGSRFYGIPHPAIFVVDSNGVIQNKFAEEGYQIRPGLDDVIGSLK